MRNQDDVNKSNPEYKQDSMGTRIVPDVDEAVKNSWERPSKHYDIKLGKSKVDLTGQHGKHMDGIYTIDGK